MTEFYFPLAFLLGWCLLRAEWYNNIFFGVLAPPQATNNKGFMVSKVRLKQKPQWVLGQAEPSQVIQFH